MTGSLSSPARAYIFVSSPSPDPYVNAVAAIYHQYRDTDIEIVFVGIAPDVTGASEIPSEEAASVHARVIERMRELSHGTYTVMDRNTGVTRKCRVQNTEIYRDCLHRLESSSSQQRFPRRELDSRLAEYARDNGALFDVTALLKSHLLDVAAILLSRGCRNLRYFELAGPPHHDERDLIHNLGVHGYRYVDISQSTNVQRAVQRISRHSLALRIVILGLLLFTILGIAAQLIAPKSPLASVLQIVGIGAGGASAVLQVVDFWRK